MHFVEACCLLRSRCKEEVAAFGFCFIAGNCPVLLEGDSMVIIEKVKLCEEIMFLIAWDAYILWSKHYNDLLGFQ